jgi:Ca-activated chloride channel family protein
MSTKYLALSGALFLLVFVSACGPAATQAPAPATRAPSVYAPVQAYPTQAPTQAASMNQGAPHHPSNTQPYDMFFQNYGVNPSVDTEDDHLSTFALDVDTGSYTIMRNYLSEGNLPPKDSVRVEEYVNYFEQDYPNPPAHQAFGIYVDGAPSPFGETERYRMLRIGIQGYAIPEDERKDASLTFVIDVSGSMSLDNRLGLVKRSLEILVEQLRPEDRVSIVVYGSQARVVLYPTPGSDKGSILEAIHSLETDGATNAEAGLRLGYKIAAKAFNPEGINRLILCSDGVANVGETGPDAILGEVRRYTEKGITLTTIGFGMDNYNDILMEQLADDGDGFYAYVDNLKEARRLFIDNLTSTLQVIAMDAKVQVEFNPEMVSRYRLVGFENRAVADEDFRDNKVDAGELGAGHSVTALYEIKLHPEAYGRIATVYLRWGDPETHQVTEMSRDFNVSEMTSDFHRASLYFQRDVLVAEYAEILRESYWAEGSTLNGVYDETLRVADLLEGEADMEEFVNLVRQARRLSDP